MTNREQNTMRERGRDRECVRVYASNREMRIRCVLDFCKNRPSQGIEVHVVINSCWAQLSGSAQSKGTDCRH